MWVLAYGKCPKHYSNSWAEAEGTNIASKETTPEIAFREKNVMGLENLNWLM